MNSILRYTFLLLTAITIFSNCKKETGSSTNPSKDLAETSPAVQTAMQVRITNNVGGFYQALPAHYDSTTTKYPLLISLHGITELGNGTTDLPKVLTSSVPQLLDQRIFPAQFTLSGKTFSFIVISPQFKQWPEPSDVNTLIDYALAHYRIDSTRIYITGISMGGGSTWDYAISHANRLAAIVPIAGASFPAREQFGEIARANLPVWAFHNMDDIVIGYSATTMAIDFINSFNPSITAKKTIWSNGGHDAWNKATSPDTRACNGMNIYEWMLQYTRKAGN